MTSDDLLDFNLARLTEKHILATIEYCHGSLTQAAILLGISYRTLTSTKRRWRVRDGMSLDPIRRGRPYYNDKTDLKFAALIDKQADRIRELECELARIRKMLGN